MLIFPKASRIPLSQDTRGMNARGCLLGTFLWLSPGSHLGHGEGSQPIALFYLVLKVMDHHHHYALLFFLFTVNSFWTTDLLFWWLNVLCTPKYKFNKEVFIGFLLLHMLLMDFAKLLRKIYKKHLLKIWIWNWLWPEGSIGFCGPPSLRATWQSNSSTAFPCRNQCETFLLTLCHDITRPWHQGDYELE